MLKKTLREDRSDKSRVFFIIREKFNSSSHGMCAQCGLVFPVPNLTHLVMIMPLSVEGNTSSHGLGKHRWR